MNILLVGLADSIFFEHYTKNLKKLDPNLKIDIFSIEKTSGKYDLSACDNVYENNFERSFFNNLKMTRVFIKPFYIGLSLYFFLKNSSKEFDIIHYKWLVPSSILFPRLISKYSKKMIATFWGGELERQKLFNSKFIYIHFLKKFLRKVDKITHFTEELYTELKMLNTPEDKLVHTLYGSSICNELERLISYETKVISKVQLGLNPDKITISIGYSGKEVHQHIKILNELFKNNLLVKNKANYIFVLPMTHGCTQRYFDEVISLVKKYGFEHIIFTKHMSDFQIARIRNATDIMVQLSSVDGRSASIIESLLAGTILISGKWLPYKTFREKKIHFHELEAINESLPELILEITANIDLELKKCKKNKEIWGFETWDKVIPYWMNIYKNALTA